VAEYVVSRLTAVGSLLVSQISDSLNHSNHIENVRTALESALYYSDSRVNSDEVFHLNTEQVNNIRSLISNLGRIILATIFVGSYFMQPLRIPLTTLWARIIESDKPVFTLLFGGTAAIAKTAQELAKLL
jgi:hypothetical protein